MLASNLRSFHIQVWGGFVAAVLLLLAVIGLGVTQMTRLNNQLVQVVSVNNVKARLVAQMRDTLRDRALLMHNIVVTSDPWQRDEIFRNFLKLGEHYARDRQQLAGMLRNSEEKQLLTHLDFITRDLQPVMLFVVDAAISQENEAALAQLQSRAIPLQVQQLGVLNKMSTMQSQETQQALNNTLSAYQSTRTLMGILATVATLLAILVAWLISRRSLGQARQMEIEKQKYKTLFETNTDAVFILGEGGFTDCNPATLALFGLDSVVSFLQTPLLRLGAPIQANGMSALAKIMRSISHARQVGHASTDWIGRRHDGSTFYAEIALHAMELEGKPVIQAIMRDVSERYATEAVREAARQTALEAARAKSEFVATVSHEIRTPMHGILGMSELLLKTSLDDGQREYAGLLKNSVSHLLEIINDILDFSKIEVGKLAIERIPFSPAGLLKGLIDTFQSRALDKGVLLLLDLPAQNPAILLGDPTRLRQILQNLLDNAIKFTSRGEVRLSARYQTDAKRIVCFFAVSDTGIGIPSDALNHVFEAFSQADNSTTRVFGGTGLGLTISKQLANLMGGTLQVESQIGRGSRFTLCVSLLPGSSQIASNTTTPQPVGLEGRVLVVEDHPVNQKVLAHQLGEMGLQYQIAETGPAALAHYEEMNFDLILMDWQMPEMDGLEVIRRIRLLENDTRHVPIIVITANASTTFRETCLAAGADDYLSKPYSEFALISTLSCWLVQPVNLPALEAPANLMQEHFDRQALLARYQNNQALVDQLSTVFLETTQQSLATIRTAFAAGNLEKCLRETHALRGAAASVLAQSMQGLASELEVCLKTPVCHDGPRLLQAMETELTELESLLQKD